MKQTILKNFHRPIGWPAFLSNMGWMRNGMYTVSRKIRFHDNCAYNLGDSDQHDWNKLFGLCFGIFGIHKHSVRFGWRYSLDKRKIEICAIVYDGDLIIRDYMECDLPVEKDFWFTLNLTRILDGTIYAELCVTDGTDDGLTQWAHYQMDRTPRLRFGAGFYFGGNKRAPHDISITKNR